MMSQVHQQSQSCSNMKSIWLTHDMWQSKIEFRYYADLISLNYFEKKNHLNVMQSKTTVICKLLTLYRLVFMNFKSGKLLMCYHARI